MSSSLADNSMERRGLLETMQTMRSLVEPEGPPPASTPVDWHIPHRLSSDAIELLELFSEKLAGYLERSVNQLSGQTFEVKRDGIFERFANRLFDDVIQHQPHRYYLPLTQADKGHIGFLSVSFESAAILVGCMLRDPEAQIGADGQMSSLAESIFLDGMIGLAEALVEGFKEYGQTTLEKTEHLVNTDWPVRFCDLEDMCEFRFSAVQDKTTLTLSLYVLDEVIADIAHVKGPFGRAEEKKEHPERVINRMHEAAIQATALLSSALMTLNDILSLERDDVVVLDRKIDEPIDILINGQACFGGWPASHLGRGAVLIADEKSRINR